MGALKYIVIGGGLAAAGFLIYQKVVNPTKTLGDHAGAIVDGVKGVIAQFTPTTATRPAPGQSNPLSSDSPFVNSTIPGGQNGAAVSDAMGTRTNRLQVMQPWGANTPTARAMTGNVRGNPYEIRPMPVARFM